MARTSTTKAAAEVIETAVVAEENMNAKKTKIEQLNDYDEIDVVALIPNISYKDSKTGDFYDWYEVGHVEPMTFETIKNMWRNHKDYFRNMCLKPNDERVINKLGLTKTFEKYEFLMDETNYTRKDIKKVCETISNTPNGLKYVIVNKIKDMVVNGQLSDVSVIRELEKQFDLDLISFLG